MAQARNSLAALDQQIAANPALANDARVKAARDKLEKEINDYEKELDREERRDPRDPRNGLLAGLLCLPVNQAGSLGGCKGKT